MPDTMRTVAVQPPQGLVYFGDSTTDPGNLFAITEGLIDEGIRASSGGPNGEASDGPTHATYAAAVLGVATLYNYAIAAAEAAGVQTLGALLAEGGGLIVPPDDPRLGYDINLGAQIDRFQADFTEQDQSGLTAVILIGGNDYLALAGGTLAALLAAAAPVRAQAVAATLAAAQDLLAGGVGSVVIYTLLEPSFYPTATAGSEAQRAIAAALFDSHNAALAAGAADLAAEGLEVRLVDLSVLTDALTDDPSSFGFIAPRDLLLTTGDPEQLAQYDADQVLFWDGLHVTTATHGVIGAFTAHVLEGESVALSDSGDAATGGQGEDLVFAYAGADEITAGAAADSVFGGSGPDRIWGAGGRDQLSGGSDADWLGGAAGRDVLAGESGDDMLRGGVQGDVLIDGPGNDTLFGGYGDDTFIFVEPGLNGSTETFADNFHGRIGNDTLYLVLDAESAAQAGTQATAELLAGLGIATLGIEQVIILDGREGLEALAGQDWFASADLWGLV